MKKLTTLVIASSIAFAGAAFAGDKVASPTVADNPTTTQNLSYSDKSPAAKGSNAPMDANATTTESPKMAKKPVKATKSSASDTDLKMKADIGSGTTPSAPVAGSKAASVNDTTGKSGQ